MKFNLLSPNYPPAHCGVGDYTYFLSQSLMSQGHQVKIYTAKNLEEFFSSSRDADEINFLQYTPQLYPSFFRLLSILKQMKGLRIIGFHELYYPPSWTPRGLIIGVPHWIRFILLIHFVDLSIFSTAGFRERWVKRLPYLKSKLITIPVGSNIPVASSGPKERGEIVLLHFGGAHPTHLYDYIFTAWETAQKLHPEKKIKLVLVGVERKQLEAILIHFPKVASSSEVEFLGYLDSEAVSRAIHRSDLVLAPFLDGVTTRRGSVMAALAHGKRVVTTYKRGDDFNSIKWEEFLDGAFLEDLGAREKYSLLVSAKITEADELKNKKEKAALQYFNSYFSWPIIAQEISSLITAFSKSSSHRKTQNFGER